MKKMSKRRILDGLTWSEHVGEEPECLAHVNPSKILRLDVFECYIPILTLLL